MILSGLVDSPIIPVTNFQFWLTFQEIWSKWGKHLYASESLFKGCNVFPQCNYDFEWFSWFPIILLLIFNLWLTFQEIWLKWGKHLYASESLFKGCNVFPQCNSMILSGLVDSPIIPVTNFQFVTNISGDMIENEENQIKTLICFWITFQSCNVFPQCTILWFWVV